MNKYNLSVLTNIIGAVETGGQEYGKRRYADYTAPYTNSSAEHTCTLGWAAYYGDEAEKLIRRILAEDPAAFRAIDRNGVIEKKLAVNWVGTKWNPTATQKKLLIALIDSETGHKVQDRMFEELMASFIADCAKTYTKDIQAQMMYCEIRHLGGKKAADRIFGRCDKSYSLNAIMSSLRQEYDTSNMVGSKKYWSRHVKCEEFIRKYAQKEESDMKTILSNSGHDENGTYHGGKAGDQSGTEWQLIPWYNRPWKCILRHPKKAVREKICELAVKAAKNDKVGYDQYERTSYWKQLKSVGYDPAKIKTACEADCSAGVLANVKAAGYLLGDEKLQAVDPDGYTGNMREMLKDAGFKVLTTQKYLTSSDYLVPGDILLNDGHHASTNTTYGAKAGGSDEKKETQAVDPAESFDKSIAGKYRVTTALYLRAGASKDKEALAVMPEGAEVQNYGYFTEANGRRWLYVAYKDLVGFASGIYMVKV